MHDEACSCPQMCRAGGAAPHLNIHLEELTAVSFAYLVLYSPCSGQVLAARYYLSGTTCTIPQVVPTSEVELHYKREELESFRAYRI